MLARSEADENQRIPQLTSLSLVPDLSGKFTLPPESLDECYLRLVSSLLQNKIKSIK